MVALWNHEMNHNMIYLFKIAKCNSACNSFLYFCTDLTFVSLTVLTIHLLN